MTKDFPYTLLNKPQITEQINRLAIGRIPFLFIIDYKAEHGYVIKQDELNPQFVRFEIQSANKQINPVIDWSVKPISMEVTALGASKSSRAKFMSTITYFRSNSGCTENIPEG